MDTTSNLTRDPELERLLVLYYAGQCPPQDQARVERLLRESPAERHVLGALKGDHESERPNEATLAAAFDELLARVRRNDAPARGAYRAPRGNAWRWTGAVTAVAALLITIAVLRWPTATPVPQRTIHTASGERATIQLADGSSIVLGAQSTLRYSTTFGQSDRDIHLDGEAYFTVAHQSTRPFVVHTRRAVTRVLGTTFIVKAYAADADARVIVTDGRVAVRRPNDAAMSGTTLQRGDLAHVDRVGAIAVAHNVPVEQYLEWMRGHLVYTHTALADVIPDMERWYGLKIVLKDPALARTWVTITLDVESADQAITALSRISGLRCERAGNTITISRER